MEVVLLDVQGSQVNRWDVFDQQTPVVPAATFFTLALGVALGAVIGRPVPAMAATPVTFVAVRLGIAEVLRNLLGASVGQPSYVVQYFQPGDRFWAFQTIESAILASLALLILGFAIYWVTRRLT